MNGNTQPARLVTHVNRPVDITNEEDGTAELTRLRTFTIWQAVSAAASLDPDRSALVGANDAGVVSRLTYGELLQRVRDLSAGLAGIGVHRGDRVALWMTNTFEWVVSALATLRIGAILVPVNTFLKPPEIKYFIEQSGARHLLMVDGFRAVKMPEQLAEICPEIKTAQHPGFLFSPSLPDLRTIVLHSRSGGKLDCALDFKSLARDATPEDHALADRMEAETLGSDLGMVKYTSGSTAFPKGVMLEQGGIVANAVLHSRRMEVGASDVYFSMMPFFHGGGSIYGLMTMLVNGGTLVFTEAFNANLAVDLIVSEQATVFNTMLGDEVMQAALAKKCTFPSIRIADLPNEAARLVMPNVTSCFAAYGITEAVAAVSLSSYLPNGPRVANGRLLDGNIARIVDPETREDLPAGRPGELLLCGNLARGYWNKPEETARAFAADGWLKTEDICSIDSNGYLTWHGRLKLMLKVGGENVSLEEVERIVTSHDRIAACAAVGVPDKRKHEAVRVYVQLLPGADLGGPELSAWLKPRLAHFKLPRDIIFVDAVPRLGNGKLDRLTLAKWALETAGVST